MCAKVWGRSHTDEQTAAGDSLGIPGRGRARFGGRAKQLLKGEHADPMAFVGGDDLVVPGYQVMHDQFRHGTIATGGPDSHHREVVVLDDVH